MSSVATESEADVAWLMRKFHGLTNQATYERGLQERITLGHEWVHDLRVQWDTHHFEHPKFQANSRWLRTHATATPAESEVSGRFDRVEEAIGHGPWATAELRSELEGFQPSAAMTPSPVRPQD